jgi:putative transposase
MRFYKFKLLLKWYAKKYGKKVVDCNEAYTSKTRSWSGEIDLKLGPKKVIKDKSKAIQVDRDINGAKNIFIKCLSLAASFRIKGSLSLESQQQS